MRALSRKRLTRLLSSLRGSDAASRGLPDTLTGAAAQGDLASMTAFLERGAVVGERTPGFASPLVAACTAGRLEAARLLIEKGADLRPRDAVVTPVQAAVMNGHVEIVKLLEAANLVVTLRRGREKLHYLNPVPIHEIADRWISRFERGRLRALADLKAQLESKSDE